MKKLKIPRTTGTRLGLNTRGEQMNGVKEDLGEVVLYQAEDGKTLIDVRLENETVWLPQAEIARLFDVNVPGISKHIRNIYDSGELDSVATVSKKETVRTEGNRQVKRKVDFYNLDVIISVGYRVNSSTATQFRIWATGVLRRHLIDGYTLNERRLHEKGLTEAQQAIQILSRTLNQYELVSERGKGVIEVIDLYAKSWLLLQKYDENELQPPVSLRPTQSPLSYENAKAAIGERKSEFNRKKGSQRPFRSGTGRPPCRHHRRSRADLRWSIVLSQH